MTRVTLSGPEVSTKRTAGGRRCGGRTPNLGTRNAPSVEVFVQERVVRGVLSVTESVHT